MVGHTGVMLNDNASHLISLGISPSRVGPCLNAIAAASLCKSCAILSCFPVNQHVPANALPIYIAVQVQVSRPPSTQRPPLPPPTVVSPAQTYICLLSRMLRSFFRSLRHSLSPRLAYSILIVICIPSAFVRCHHYSPCPPACRLSILFCLKLAQY